MLLNRRGFATCVFCRQCGHDARVPELQRLADRAQGGAAGAVPLLQLRDRGAEGVRASAPGQYLEQIGFGTERVEAEIAALFPDARVARVDRDTIRRRGAIAALLARFAAGEIDILVGTQMIAKGHDFPQRHAGRRHLRRRRPRAGGLPRRRADVSAADPGRRPRRPRRDPGEAIVQTLYPGALQHPPRLPAGLRARSTSDEIEFRQSHAVSAGGGADQRRREGADASRRRMEDAAEVDQRAALGAASLTACWDRRRRRSAA